MISHQTSPLLVHILTVSNYISTFCWISWWTLVFLKRPTFANNKKIQSSKSWYLKIALILSIENPLPRGVVVRTVNNNPEERGSSPPCNIYKFAKNLRKIILTYITHFTQPTRQRLTLSPSLVPMRIFLHGNSWGKNPIVHNYFNDPKLPTCFARSSHTVLSVQIYYVWPRF